MFVILSLAGKTERILLQERVNQETREIRETRGQDKQKNYIIIFNRSPKKESVAEVMKREEKTINEITKLKEDIEYLAHSFKVRKNK